MLVSEDIFIPNKLPSKPLAHLDLNTHILAAITYNITHVPLALLIQEQNIRWCHHYSHRSSSCDCDGIHICNVPAEHHDQIVGHQVNNLGQVALQKDRGNLWELTKESCNLYACNDRCQTLLSDLSKCRVRLLVTR